ncbi:MAG: hypothetical protein HY840_02760 [Bacteroidetes bacterium]|nr:hypothetical protein [Bacteroidota bacterium]
MENTNQHRAEKQNMILRPCTVKELSAFYRVSKTTIRKWLERYKEEIGERTGHFYMIEQVKIIFEKFGVPSGKQIVFPKPETFTDEVSEFTEAAWDFACALLWKDKIFCTEEIALSKNHLREFFTIPNKSGNPISLSKRLSVFCQRITLTRMFLDYKPQRFIPSPALWLDRNYKYGFAGTLKWFKWISEERKENPYVREELRVLADLYCEYIKTKSAAEVMNKAGDYFLKKNFMHLFRIFSDCISHIGNKTNYQLAA